MTHCNDKYKENESVDADKQGVGPDVPMRRVADENSLLYPYFCVRNLSAEVYYVGFVRTTSGWVALELS